MVTYRPYRIEFGVTRAPNDECSTEQLLDFIFGLPNESSLKRHLCLASDHSDKYPRLAMQLDWHRDLLRPVPPPPAKARHCQRPVWTLKALVSFTDNETAEQLMVEFAKELEPAGWQITSPNAA